MADKTETTVRERQAPTFEEILIAPLPADAATRTKLEERAQRVDAASDHLEDAVGAFLDDGGDRDDVGRIVERVHLRLSRENDAVTRENADRAANLDKKGEPDPQKPRALPHPKLLA